jgi:predicted AAA+ superfamily ATPase
MHDFIPRKIEDFVMRNLSAFPAVAILGPRQCGKSTLAKMLSARIPAFLYLDLQNPADFNKLTDPLLFFTYNEHATICLDEIQLLPEIFPVLRSVIDRNRKPGRFILLGSASRDLIRQTSESLAGRIGIIELSPFTLDEIHHEPGFNLQKFWFRGGYPDSYLSKTVDESQLWRENFIRTYLERDIPQLGFQIPGLQLRRLLTMCAHNQGQLLNASKLGESLSLTHPTIRRYIDLFEQTFIFRTLYPYDINVKKRLVKSPKIYFRDSGLLNRILQIEDFNDLLGNPVYGASWEGLVIENILSCLRDWSPFFYRTATGDEIDLVLVKGEKILAVECKASTSPQLTKGFWRSLEVLNPFCTYVVSLIEGSYPLKENVVVCGLDYILGQEILKQ